MRPWRWAYWRVAHVLGWHYVGQDVNRRKCYFCAWQRKPLSQQEWADLFDQYNDRG